MALDAAVDEVRDKFGSKLLTRGVLLGREPRDRDAAAAERLRTDPGRNRSVAFDGMTPRETYPPGVTCFIDTEREDVDAAAAFYGGLFGWSFDDV